MAAGISQPAGPGTDIIIFDDSDTGGGRPAGPYTFAQISAAFPLDFIDLGTYQKSYRSLVNLKMGDATAVAAVTTLQDTNVKVSWDLGFTLTYRASQQSSWFTTLGTKCGAGNQAGGANGCDLTFGADTTLRGTVNLYGSKLRKKATLGRITMTTGITGNSGELVDSDLQSDAVFNAYIFGSTTQKVANAYNCTFSAPTAAGQPVIGNFFFASMERILLAAQSNLSFIATNAQDIGFKDLVMKGTIVAADFRLNSGAARWSMVRPGWSQSGLPKIAFTTAFSITLANALKEYWLYTRRVADEDGNPIAGVQVKLMDAIGTTIVDAPTDSEGKIVFGSGLTGQAVIVMDHYGTTGTWLRRYRGPFTEEINLSGTVNPNVFHSRRVFHWPGYQTYTANSGTFEDVSDVVVLPSVIDPESREEHRPSYA